MFNVNGNSLPGPLIIGTFEKRAPAPLTDQQKTHRLSDKHSAHLKSSKQDNNIYLPSQPIWFTDDSSDE